MKNPSKAYIKQATADYLKRGGKITKIDTNHPARGFEGEVNEFLASQGNMHPYIAARNMNEHIMGWR